jgi:crotonobetainyl-CoA:carnitine CoA-transferase CaiB-like acyl-CoA transferase
VEALDGWRVVEVGGQIAAPYATKLLLDLGATVAKVEPPAGDPLRNWGRGTDPAGKGEGGFADPRRREPEPAEATRKGLYRYLNTGKHEVTVDLEGADGAAWLVDAVREADVLIESLGAGALEQIGLGPARLFAASPRLALVRIAPFGQHGPHVGAPVSMLTLQALGGWVSNHNVAGSDPVQVGGRLPEYTAGSYAACAAASAVRAARDLGEPVTVDLSMQECLVGTLAYPMLHFEALSRLGLPPPQARHFPLPGIVRARDGWVGINALTGQHWLDVCAMLDVEEYGKRQPEIALGGEPLAEFFAHIQPWLDERTAEEVVEISQAMRVPAAPVGDGASLPTCAQFRARPFFTDEPATGIPMPGPAWRLSKTPARVRPQEHVLASTERPPDIPLTPKQDRGGYLPLAGTRVIDLGTFWAGPYCGMYLAAMGADVIKVESVQRPDGFRFSAAFPQEGDDWWDRSGVFQATNLGKRDLTLDLTRPEGLDILKRLLDGADVMIENFSARVVEQFGLDYESLCKITPDIVMLRMPGFGLDGPWRDYVGFAMVLEQASGMASVTGFPDKPMSPGGFLDPVVGMHAALAVQAALEHRGRTGEGQQIEIAMLEAGACLTAEQVIDHAVTGATLPRLANRHPVIAPQGVYRTADESWVALSTMTDDQWRDLAAVLGAHELANLDVAARHDRHDELDALVGNWTATQSPDEIVDRLRPLGLPVAPLLLPQAMYDEPQLAARGYYQPLDHVRTGTRRYPGWPIRFSFLPAHHRAGPPSLGQHNENVLTGELGLSEAELVRLAEDRVIGTNLG